MNPNCFLCGIEVPCNCGKEHDKWDFIICEPCDTSTSPQDILKKVTDYVKFLEDENLPVM